MILLRKFKLPRIIYRTKPLKIALMIIIPCALITGLSLGAYFIVKEVKRNTIQGEFSILNISNANKYKNLECPQLSENDLREIIIDQFNTNQAFRINTSKDIKILIDNNSSSSEKGIISFYATFVLLNGDVVNNKFTVTGFKKQPRPLPLSSNIVIQNSVLTNIYPYELVNSKGEFNINAPFYNTLKQYLFDLLQNKPTNLLIDDFTIEVQKINDSQSSANSWNGDIIIKYGLNKEKYKYPDFIYNTKVFGFNKYHLLDLTPNSDGYIDILAPTSYRTKDPNSINASTIKQIIVDELIKNDRSIPLKKEDINIEINKIDPNNGLISLKFLQITTFYPVKTYSNVRVLGFRDLKPTLKNPIINSHFFQSLTTNEIDTLKLQEIVFNNLTIPQGLRLSPYDIIVQDIISSDYINGVIKLKVSIKGYIDNPIKEIITINNFKIYRPLPMESEYVISSEYANLKPSEIDDAILQRIVFSYIPSAPSGLLASDINIISKQPDDQAKTIVVTGNIPIYSEKNPYNFTVKFTGFN